MSLKRQVAVVALVAICAIMFVDSVYGVDVSHRAHATLESRVSVSNTMYAEPTPIANQNKTTTVTKSNTTTTPGPAPGPATTTTATNNKTVVVTQKNVTTPVNKTTVATNATKNASAPAAPGVNAQEFTVLVRHRLNEMERSFLYNNDLLRIFNKSLMAQDTLLKDQKLNFHKDSTHIKALLNHAGKILDELKGVRANITRAQETLRRANTKLNLAPDGSPNKPASSTPNKPTANKPTANKTTTTANKTLESGLSFIEMEVRAAPADNIMLRASEELNKPFSAIEYGNQHMQNFVTKTLARTADAMNELDELKRRTDVMWSRNEGMYRQLRQEQNDKVGAASRGTFLELSAAPADNATTKTNTSTVTNKTTTASSPNPSAKPTNATSNNSSAPSNNSKPADQLPSGVNATTPGTPAKYWGDLSAFLNSTNSTLGNRILELAGWRGMVTSSSNHLIDTYKHSMEHVSRVMKETRAQLNVLQNSIGSVDDIVRKFDAVLVHGLVTKEIKEMIANDHAAIRLAQGHKKKIDEFLKLKNEILVLVKPLLESYNNYREQIRVSASLLPNQIDRIIDGYTNKSGRAVGLMIGELKPHLAQLTSAAK
jgi:hypothetical protein